jgi:hypothetical protein
LLGASAFLHLPGRQQRDNQSSTLGLRWEMIAKMFVLKSSPTSRPRLHERQKSPIFGSIVPTDESEGFDALLG